MKIKRRRRVKGCHVRHKIVGANERRRWDVEEKKREKEIKRSHFPSTPQMQFAVQILRHGIFLFLALLQQKSLFSNTMLL